MADCMGCVTLHVCICFVLMCTFRTLKRFPEFIFDESFVK